MPFYQFRKNQKSKKSYEIFLTLSEREQYLKDNPEVVQELVGTAIVGGIGDARSKVPQDFRDILKNIKKKNPRSNIQTA